MISAGNLPWRQARVSEAEQAAYLLKEWGVPSEALLIEGQSRNTYENAQRSKPIWDAYGFHSGLLVTSASHMPRALGRLASTVRTRPMRGRLPPQAMH